MMSLWQPQHMRLTHLLQSASFCTPTLGDKLRLLTNNGAINSEPLGHTKHAQQFFWPPTGHQPSRSKHCQHSSLGHIPAPGKCCQQHYWSHSAPTQPPVNTWSSTGQHTTAAHSVFTAVNTLGISALTGYAVLALHWSTARLTG
jgi:hypothetical protein